VTEVEETSCSGEEIEGGLGISAGGLEDSTALAGPLLCFFEVEE
jgi:hypothetical protein